MITIHHGVGLSSKHVANDRVGINGQTDFDNIRYVAICITLHQSNEHGIPSHVGADLVGEGEAEGHLRLNRVVGTGKPVDSDMFTIHTSQELV